MIAELLERLRRGDRNALARLVSFAARGEHLSEIQLGLTNRREGAAPAEPLTKKGSAGASPSQPVRVVAITGSGGVGKSTLIGKLTNVVRADDKKVAVLACDPESPVTGGALLGDRFRMGSPTDDGIFIRSLAAHSGHGALADHLDVILQLLEAFGFDVVFLETVGSGQGDVAVRALADVVVLLLQPESGDDIQWEKAGILECADIVIVHKGDLPAADQTVAQVRAALDLSPTQVPVLRVSTKANQGHSELWQAIAALPLRRQHSSAAHVLFQAATDVLQRRFHAAEQSNDASVTELVGRWQRGELETNEATRRLIETLIELKSSRPTSSDK